jgi:hypothetical protein
LGLDVPDCKKDGVTQEGAKREVLGISEVFNLNNIKTKIRALEIDLEVIDAWNKTKNNIDIINGSWEFADKILEKMGHIFVYANTFGKKEDKTHFSSWKALDAEILILLCSLRNGNLGIYNPNLIKTFDNYNIYFLILSAKKRGNMRLMVLIRKDVRIDLPSKISGHHIFNLNEEYSET